MSTDTHAQALTQPTRENGDEWQWTSYPAQADPLAFGEIYHTYLPRIYAFVAAHTRSVEEAEDVTSAAFEKALRALPGDSGRGSLEAWLFRIALNCLRDHYRQARQRSHTPLPSDAEWPALHDTQEEVLGHLADEEVRRRLRELPVAQREAVTLMVLADLSPREIARILGKRSGAVRGLLHRALRTLKEKTAHD